MAAPKPGIAQDALEEFHAKLDAFVESLPPRFKSVEETDAFRARTQEERTRLKAQAENLGVDFVAEVRASQARVEQRRQAG